MQRTSWEEATRVDGAVLALAALASLALGAIGARAPLSLEEIDTLDAARRSFAAAPIYASPAHHPLYALLAHCVTTLLGEDPLVLRLPALLCGAGSVLALGWIGLQATTRRSAWLAAFLLALSYPMVVASETARGYSAALLLALLATGLLLRVQRGGGRRAAVGLAACCVLLLLCHWTLAVFLAALVLGGAATCPARAGRIAACGALALLVCAPVLLAASASFDAREAAATALWQVALSVDDPREMLGDALSDLTRGRRLAWFGLLLLAPAGVGAHRMWRSAARALPALTLLHLLFATLQLHLLGSAPWILLPVVPFSCLFVVEGVFAFAAMAERVARHLAGRTPRAEILGVAATAPLLLASSVGAIRAWEAAEDVPAALAFVAEQRAPEDAARARVAVGPLAFALREHDEGSWLHAPDAAALREMEAHYDEIVVLQGFRPLMRRLHPDLLIRLEQEFEPSHRIQGRRTDLVVHRSKFADVEIVAHDLGGGFHVLRSMRGSNTLVLAGEEGLLLVDPSHWGLQRKLDRALRALGGGTPRWVFDSHWHFDHSGGNEALARRGATVVATRNARDRMRAEFERKGFESPASLPRLLVEEPLRMEFAGQVVEALPMPPAHTDGDLVVSFPEAGIVHMGDLFVNGGFPYISAGSGGRVDGVIAAQRRVLALADETTRIVPGHGPVGGTAELRAAHDMLVAARERVARLKLSGLDLDATLEADPLQDLERAWGGGWIDSRSMAEFVYETLPESPAPLH